MGVLTTLPITLVGENQRELRGVPRIGSKRHPGASRSIASLTQQDLRGNPCHIERRNACGERRAAFCSPRYHSTCWPSDCPRRRRKQATLLPAPTTSGRS